MTWNMASLIGGIINLTIYSQFPKAWWCLAAGLFATIIGSLGILRSYF